MKPSIDYIGRIPKTLRAYCEKHADNITEVYYGSGYSFVDEDSRGRWRERTWAYNVLLRPGWCVDDPGWHTIIRPTVAETIAELRTVIPCTCDDCENQRSSNHENT